jgi:DNA (cytosine-5)-methyltransferase 1
MNPSDARNKLVLEFARLVVEFAPSFFVLENVKGFANERYSPLLKRFKAIITAAGYELSEPKVLDARDYGVPQRRTRVFLVGSRRGLEGFKFPTPVARSKRPTVWDAIGDLGVVYEHCRLRGVETFPGKVKARNNYVRGLVGGTSLTGFGHTEHSPATVRRFKLVEPGQADRVSRFIRLTKHGTSSTLRAGTGPENGSFMAPRPIHPTRPRCICVREAARLQSFPDWFVFHEVKWHAFRQIGNSVPPKLARAVAAEVCAALFAKRESRSRRAKSKR